MNIGIIGLGLIGGSLGRAIIEKTNHKVFGFDISAYVMAKAKELAAMHFPLTEGDYKKLDMLIIALMPRACVKIMQDVVPKLQKGTFVLDIGGNKTMPVREMQKLSLSYPYIKFIATHPMAGKEVAGIENSNHALFCNASILTVPVRSTPKDSASVKKLFLNLGFAKVLVTDESTHDSIIAYTSQLAHIISSSYVQSDLSAKHEGFSAGSFHDLSRVAKMNPDMWTELIFDNRTFVLPELKAFINRLNAFKDALENGLEARVKDFFEKGNRIKERLDRKKVKQ